MIPKFIEKTHNPIKEQKLQNVQQNISNDRRFVYQFSIYLFRCYNA